MRETIVALFDNSSDAHAAVRELVDNGFTREAISIVGREGADQYGELLDPMPMDDTVEGVASGALLGGLTGLVVGLFALAIPGVGPVIAAGPIAAALTGAGVGAVTGGLVGALVDLGYDEDTAGHYAEGVRRGGVLLTVNTGNRHDLAHSIISRFNPVDIDHRVADWREEGYNRFDPAGQSYRM
jgi:uncharacterized membrane protein